MQKHWNTQESALQLDCQFQNFFRSPSHEESLARLEFLLDQRRRFGIVLGSEGAGKSSLLAYFAHALRFRSPSCYMRSMIGCRGTEFVFWLAQSLYSLANPGQEGTAASWNAIHDGMTASAYDGRNVVILLDDLHRAHVSVFEELERLFALIGTTSASIVTIASSEADGALRLGRSLLNSCDLHVELEAWTTEDIAGFLDFISRRHWNGERLFADGAVQALAERSLGNLRRVVQIAELAMLNAIDAEKEVVDSDSIDRADAQLLSSRYAIALGH